MKELIELIKLPFANLLEMKPKSISKSYYLLCINLAWILPVVIYGFLKIDHFLCEQYYSVCGILCLTISLLISLTTFKIGIENCTWVKKILMKLGHGIALFFIAVVFETCIVCPLSYLNKLSESNSGYIQLLTKDQNCDNSIFIVIKPWLLKSEWEKKDEILLKQQNEIIQKNSIIVKNNSVIKQYYRQIAVKDSLINDCETKIEGKTYFKLISEKDKFLMYDEFNIKGERFALKLYYLEFSKSFIDSQRISNVCVAPYFDFYAVKENSEYNKSNNANSFIWPSKSKYNSDKTFTFSFPIQGFENLTWDLIYDPTNRSIIKISISNVTKIYSLPKDTKFVKNYL